MEFIIEKLRGKEAELIDNMIIKYNEAQVPFTQEKPFVDISRVIKDEEGNVIAGIIAGMYCWNCAYVDIIIIKEEYRKMGLGTKLLNEVERIAIENKCHLMTLDTFDFQAKDFYIKNGYEVFGILEDCPKGHERYYLRKMLNEDENRLKPDATEEMGEFFDKRANGYEDHMKETVEGFEEYYESLSIPMKETQEKIKVLDLGCGTGLHLKGIFSKAPNAIIKGIDLSQGMMDILKEQYIDKIEQIELIKDSFLEYDFGKNEYDYVVTSMAMHHFEKLEKVDLYKKIKSSLKKDGKFINGDYIVSLESEEACLERYYGIVKEIPENERMLYHIDIPFSLKTETNLLKRAGFKEVNVIWNREECKIVVSK